MEVNGRPKYKDGMLVIPEKNNIENEKKFKIIGFQIDLCDMEDSDLMDDCLKDVDIKKKEFAPVMIHDTRVDIEYIKNLVLKFIKEDAIRSIGNVGMCFNPKEYNKQLNRKFFKVHYMAYNLFCRQVGTPLYEQLLFDDEKAIGYQKMLLSIDGPMKNNYSQINEVINKLLKRMDFCIV